MAGGELGAWARCITGPAQAMLDLGPMQGKREKGRLEGEQGIPMKAAKPI